MTPEDVAATLGLPGDLRAEVLDMVETHGVPLAWLLELYRRGFNARVGPTGDFPYGRSGPEDEGELTVALGVDTPNGLVRMVFGKKVAWLSLPAGHARHLATMLTQAADQLDRSVS